MLNIILFCFYIGRWKCVECFFYRHHRNYKSNLYRKKFVWVDLHICRFFDHHNIDIVGAQHALLIYNFSRLFQARCIITHAFTQPLKKSIYTRLNFTKMLLNLTRFASKQHWIIMLENARKKIQPHHPSFIKKYKQQKRMVNKQN